MEKRIQLAVIGGGPAGLRAAETAAAVGVAVTVFDGKPSVGRKFLVAGKGGLNLTNGEDQELFTTRYFGGGKWAELLQGFSPRDLRDWADGLGVETFQAGSGRVYPTALKAAPLLRRWITRLREAGVRFEMNHQWTDLVPGKPHEIGFANGHRFSADAVVFALGGASWPQTGSDGSWMSLFQELGVACSPLVAANCGWKHPWSADLLPAIEGKPLKNIHASAEGVTAIGELLITRYGLEGGAIYQLGAILRGMHKPAITIDFKPTFTCEQLVAKMESVRRGFLDEARVRWRLPDAVHALLDFKTWTDSASLAREVKHHVIKLDGPQPVAEAISSAGGVCWSGLDDSLMLEKIPGIFVAGEMIDWEAPTGGYLMQGCFATGTRAGQGAARWLNL